MFHLSEDWLMYSITKRAFIGGLLLLTFQRGYSQDTLRWRTSVEIGGAIASAEATYYGFYAKYKKVFLNNRISPVAGLGLTSYADFKGESTEQAYLKDDLDMRVISFFYAGGQLRYGRLLSSLEFPLGVSWARTKGTFVNERIGFTRDYSNNDLLWHFGISVSCQYQFDNKFSIGINSFLPLTQDVAWSPPMLGVGLVRYIGKKK